MSLLGWGSKGWAGRGPGSKWERPRLGPERPEEEEARTNDQDPDGGAE